MLSRLGLCRYRARSTLQAALRRRYPNSGLSRKRTRAAGSAGAAVRGAEAGGGSGPSGGSRPARGSASPRAPKENVAQVLKRGGGRGRGRGSGGQRPPTAADGHRRPRPRCPPLPWSCRLSGSRCSRWRASARSVCGRWAAWWARGVPPTRPGPPLFLPPHTGAGGVVAVAALGWGGEGGCLRGGGSVSESHPIVAGGLGLSSVTQFP